MWETALAVAVPPDASVARTMKTRMCAALVAPSAVTVFAPSRQTVPLAEDLALTDRGEVGKLPRMHHMVRALFTSLYYFGRFADQGGKARA